MSQNIPSPDPPSVVRETPVTWRQRVPQQRLTVEFMYLDLNLCSRCLATEAHLAEALTEVADLLDAAGIEVTLTKIQVQSLEQAVALDFSSSPTIRVNGRDIQLDSRESHCGPCSTVGGVDTDCRVWWYQGQEYEAPPTAMIVDALLQEICGSPGTRSPRSPIADSARANLQRFFEAKQKQQEGTGAGVRNPHGKCCAGGCCC